MPRAVVGRASRSSSAFGTHQGGSPALAYDSTTVSVKPIVQVSLPSANNAALPANVTTRLTFNGTAGQAFGEQIGYRHR